MTTCNTYTANNMLRLRCLEVNQRYNCEKQTEFEVEGEEVDFNWNEWFRHITTLNNTMIGPLKFEIEWPNNDETLIEGLEKTMVMLRQPQFYVTKLVVSDFNGATTIPFWAPDKPWKESLPYLDDLELNNLENMESIQLGSRSWASCCATPICTSTSYTSGSKGACFPSLKLSNLAGWARRKNLLTLPYLSSLQIFNCRKLTSIPQCPYLLDLVLCQFNPNLQPIHLHDIPLLRMIEIDNIKWLNSLPMQAFKYLETLLISDDKGEERFEDITEVFQSCSRSLTELWIDSCPRLWSSIVVSRFDHLLALRRLTLKNFDTWPADEQEWQYLNGLQHLEKLSLVHVLTTVSMPEWVQFLPSLEALLIRSCPNLSSVPAWMPNLKSLKRLIITGCSRRLEERCSVYPPGPDWPYIQHIPTVLVEAANFRNVFI